MRKYLRSLSFSKTNYIPIRSIRNLILKKRIQELEGISDYQNKWAARSHVLCLFCIGIFLFDISLVSFSLLIH